MRFVLSQVLVVVLFFVVMTSCLNTDAERAISFEEQWVMDTTSIGSYLRSKNITAMKDASGVRFVIDSLGSGFPPRASSDVRFSYTGRLLSEAVFDKNASAFLNMKDLVPGFQIGLSLMPAGTKARIFIPSGYGYGTVAQEGIPENSNLSFDIKLLSVIVTDAEKQQLASDTVAIDNYLTANSISATKDKSGLRYTITKLGTGAIPNLYNKVRITYTGKILSNGFTFFTGTSGPSSTFDSRVINYIYGLQVALRKMPVGSKAMLYVPSGLGFGNQLTLGPNINVPANSNLIFEVELTEITE